MTRGYIWDSRPGGDLALWWRPNAAGYTANLDEAGVYTRQEYERLGVRETDLFVPEEVARQPSRRHIVVPVHKLHDLMPGKGQVGVDEGALHCPTCDYNAGTALPPCRRHGGPGRALARRV